jgi:hypothetical protein
MFGSILKFFFKLLATIALIGLFGYIFLTGFGGNFQQLWNRYFPCQMPIKYSIANFDTRFKISEEDFAKAITQAESIWEVPAGKNLFEAVSEDSNFKGLKINLVYDYRQEATEKIKDISSLSSATRSSYDSLRKQYEGLQQEFLNDKKAYEEALKAFQTKQTAYNSEVAYWNSQGGASKSEYAKLAAEQQALQKESSEIKIMEKNLNSKVSSINSLVSDINNLAKSLNLNAANVNMIGAGRGEEFTEGEYKSAPGIEEINIYEFSNHGKLVTLLAHELGHALGLDHVSDTHAIMYYLNQSNTGKATDADILALKTRCNIK